MKRIAPMTRTSNSYSERTSDCRGSERRRAEDHFPEREEDLMNTLTTMKLPPEIQFHGDIHLLVYRPHGSLDETSVNKVISVLGDLEATIKEPFDRFTDTSATDEVELNFQYIIHVSLYRRLTYAGRPAVRSAVLATDSTIIHYARLHALLTQGSPITVRIFQDRKQAADWLSVPVERLILPAASDT